jgi:hypothetical protein
MSDSSGLQLSARIPVSLMHTASKENSRYAINSVGLARLNDKQAVASTTDGRALALRVIDAEFSGDRRRYVVPPEVVVRAPKTRDPDTPVVTLNGEWRNVNKGVVAPPWENEPNFPPVGAVMPDDCARQLKKGEVGKPLDGYVQIALNAKLLLDLAKSIGTGDALEHPNVVNIFIHPLHLAEGDDAKPKPYVVMGSAGSGAGVLMPCHPDKGALERYRSILAATKAAWEDEKDAKFGPQDPDPEEEEREEEGEASPTPEASPQASPAPEASPEASPTLEAERIDPVDKDHPNDRPIPDDAALEVRAYPMDPELGYIAEILGRLEEDEAAASDTDEEVRKQYLADKRRVMDAWLQRIAVKDLDPATFKRSELCEFTFNLDDGTLVRAVHEPARGMSPAHLTLYGAISTTGYRSEFEHAGGWGSGDSVLLVAKQIAWELRAELLEERKGRKRRGGPRKSRAPKAVAVTEPADTPADAEEGDEAPSELTALLAQMRCLASA